MRIIRKVASIDPQQRGLANGAGSSSMARPVRYGPCGSRRGMSLMIVMMAISMSLVLTYAFLRAQATQLQIRQNSVRRDLALQAAETGAAVALEQMQSPDWQGVSVDLRRLLHSDADGQTAFHVEYLPLTARDDQPLPDDAALSVVIRSTGIWQPPPTEDDDEMHDPSDAARVERVVEVVATLHPRLPGRSVFAGDSTIASDAAPNPGDYDAIQQYALYADGGSPSLVLEPGGRIDGPLWLYDELQPYRGPEWESHIRRRYLDDLGAQFVHDGEPTTVRHPHPVSGEITFFVAPNAWHRDDLRRMGLDGRWSQSDRRLSYPLPGFPQWATYRIYEGGFSYAAPTVGSTLRNVTLRPTADNPLGIFYCDGPVRIEDHVTIQGTLIARGRVHFKGRSIVLTAFNWRGKSGVPLVEDATFWPRLPAVVAADVEFSREASVLIDGAIVASHEVFGAGGMLEAAQVNAVTIDGTATSTPLEQPWSLVRVQTPRALSILDGSGNYAIWLSDGDGGAWHPIVGVDPHAGTLKIVGEVRHAVPTAFRIRRARQRFVDIHGPVSALRYEFRCQSHWRLSRLLWFTLHELWKLVNRDREREGQPPVSLLDWLADRGTFLGWPAPYSTDGLSLEPTLHLRHDGRTNVRWEPPLFRAYVGSGENAEFSGYRWDVVSWREIL